MTPRAVPERRGSDFGPARSKGGRPGLSRDEEADLAARVARGDRQARDRFVESNLGLVHSIARGFLGRGLELDDLVGEGYLGLFRAVEGYDPGFGTRFVTYAGHWIKQAIRRALIETTATIRLPAHMASLLICWRRAEQALDRELGKMPTADEVASSLGLSEAQQAMVRQAHRAARLRLESSYEGEEGSRLLADVADPHGTEDPAVAADEWAAAMRRLERLEGGERDVVSLLFGLKGEALSIEEIGRVLGVSRRRVRRTERRALSKLRGTPKEEEAAGARP